MALSLMVYIALVLWQGFCWADPLQSCVRKHRILCLPGWRGRGAQWAWCWCWLRYTCSPHRSTWSRPSLPPSCRRGPPWTGWCQSRLCRSASLTRRLFPCAGPASRSSRHTAWWAACLWCGPGTRRGRRTGDPRWSYSRNSQSPYQLQ